MCAQATELGTTFLDWRCLNPGLDNFFFVASLFNVLKPFLIGTFAGIALLVANARALPRDQVMAQTKSDLAGVMVHVLALLFSASKQQTNKQTRYLPRLCSVVYAEPSPLTCVQRTTSRTDFGAKLIDRMNVALRV